MRLRHCRFGASFRRLDFRCFFFHPNCAPTSKRFPTMNNDIAVLWQSLHHKCLPPSFICRNQRRARSAEWFENRRVGRRVGLNASKWNLYRADIRVPKYLLPILNRRYFPYVRLKVGHICHAFMGHLRHRSGFLKNEQCFPLKCRIINTIACNVGVAKHLEIGAGFQPNDRVNISKSDLFQGKRMMTGQIKML